jgi:Protein of unknown function (DUF3551)
MTLSFRSTIVSTLVRAFAYTAIATPASAHTHDYCRRDATSFMGSCDFDTLAQCQVMSAGIGGDCYRDPFVGDASGGYAHAPIRTPARTGRGKKD